MTKAADLYARRERRIRHHLRLVGRLRPRLSVYRSSKHIYAQVIDDERGITLASASSIDKGLKGSLAKGCDVGAAAQVGKLVAERAKAAGVNDVVFDRGGYKYHGRIKALADAAREGGLNF